MRALTRKLVRDLWWPRTQVAAIALVVAAGVAMVVVFASTFDSLRATRDTYYRAYRFADAFATLTRAPDRLAATLEAIPGIDAVDTRIVAEVTLDVPGVNAPIAGRMLSTPVDRPPRLNDVTLRAGRPLSADRPDDVWLLEPFARAHRLRPGDTLGATIAGRRRVVQVAGLVLSPEYVYAVRPGEIMADNRAFGVLWMGRRPLAVAAELDGAFNDVAVTIARGATERDVLDRLDRALAPYGGTGAIPRRQQLSAFFLDGELNQLVNLGRILPVIFLGISAFLLNVVLSRLVTIQRQAIATLKALGYGHRAIGGHVLSWSLAVSLLGGVIGVAAGAWMGHGMTRIYTDFFHFPLLVYRLRPDVVAGSLAIALASGAAGGWWSFRQVVRLAPADAMRPAPPAAFHRLWLERGRIGRALAPTTRIVWRSLSRHPMRAAFAVAGLACGTATLIVAAFSLDAMDRVMERQFTQADRSDATVAFRRPRPAAAVWEVARLPGVWRAEPTRVVPVRLSAGPRRRTTAIRGVAAGSTLTRVIDDVAGPVTMPEDGVLLSSVLAARLGVVAGDRVEVEILTGGVPVQQVPVAGTVAEFVGTNVYMDLDALRRLLREGASVSGVSIAADPAEWAHLDTALKARADVAAVTTRRDTRAAFERTIAASVGIMRTAAVLFAFIITFGVMYNTARIALSERDRDLATLRVIGYTRGEIAAILFGELGLMLAASLPAGVLLGHALAAWMVAAFETDLYDLPLVISPRTDATAVLVAMATAVVPAWAVRRRLDHLDLVAVLKTRE